MPFGALPAGSKGLLGTQPGRVQVTPVSETCPAVLFQSMGKLLSQQDVCAQGPAQTHARCQELSVNAKGLHGALGTWAVSIPEGAKLETSVPFPR